FKSFPDKTRLNFREQITAVLGPNGCGKSNIADSIGWVLGLQNARNLRGQTIEDVIFSGTEKRRPSGFAEVRLKMRLMGDVPVIWNETEYREKQLEVSRRVDRNGDSYYQINQKRCRLMDLKSMLEAVGLGSASYALIAQGEIESFLTAKPLDRRVLIEEAAQIHGYKIKRRNAEQKLELAQQNLLRINDIVSEVERGLRALKRQANKAARYKTLREEFKGIQKLRFTIESANIKGELEVLAVSLKETRDEDHTLKLDLEGREHLFQESSSSREQLQAELSSLQQVLSETRLELDRSRNAILHYAEQTENHNVGLEADELEEEEVKASLEKLTGENSGLEQENQQLIEKESALKEILKNQREEVEQFDKKLRAAEDLLEKERNGLVSVSSEIVSVQNNIDQVKNRVRMNETDYSRLQEDRAEFSRRLDEARLTASEKNNLLEGESARLTLIREEILRLTASRDKIRAALDELESGELEIKNKLIAARERLHSLEELEISRSQYSEGFQEALKHFRHSPVTPAGTFADFVDTNPEFEKVVEEFLSNELEYVLVDSVEQALQGLWELRSSETGKCTFLALHGSELQASPAEQDEKLPLLLDEPGVYGRLGDLLNFKASVGNAFLRVFPQHAEAIVISDIDRALELSKSYPEKTFITLNGEAFASRGMLSTSKKAVAKLGLLGLKRQKKDLDDRITILQKELKSISKKIEAENNSLKEINTTLQNAEASALKTEKDLIGIQHECELAGQESSRQESGVRNAESALEQLTREKTELERRLENQTDQLSAKKQSLSDYQQQLEKTRFHIQEMRSQGETARGTLGATVSDQKVITEKKIALNYAISRINSQRIELETRVSSVIKRKQIRKSKLYELSRKSAEQKEAVVKFETRLSELEKSTAGSSESLAQARQEGHKLEELLHELRDKRSILLEKKSSLEIENARLETRLQNLETTCQEQLKMMLEEVEASTDSESVENCDEILQRYSELSENLESFGPVNMTALEEFQENEERYNFLTTQKNDIEKSIADTKQAIQEINSRSRIQFSKAFKEINKNFNTVFQKLFGGGECGMELMDNEDILDCGIDVIAQPPGKRLQNILLLSGGEKALTVFALLVGIFMYRPSRFCILDEIDAPLDDANVERFSELIKEMSGETQFIVITHNKQTMKVAEILYGITMEEPGVSKVLAVNI
ncbi:MAG: chromosome segregation protein SMC, partial [Acidobacteriota bacterium]